MNKLLTALFSLALIGCASTYSAAPQNYRLKGADNALTITGKLDRKANLTGNEFNLTVFFNNNPQINLALDSKATGEGAGLPYEGKQTSTSCSSKAINETNTEVRCIVFIENERTVTLTF